MKQKNRSIASLLIVPVLLGWALVFSSCEKGVDVERTKQELMAADRAFSALSVEKGVPHAFDAYMADDAAVYREKSHPIVGRAALNEIYSKSTGYLLEWEPAFADAGASGDFGYTRGRWQITPDGEDEPASYGYYVTIWKRQPDGSWKWVFDTGVNGPDEKETK